MGGIYRTIDDVRKANQDAGRHWFNDGWMEAFDCRIGRRIKNIGLRVYFVSSCGPSTAMGTRERRFTLHYMDCYNVIHNQGAPRRFKTQSEAWASLRM